MNLLSRPVVLRDFPLASRLVIAAFLLSVGIGYFSALVHMHFQHASPGKMLPNREDAITAYHGRSGMSQMERLLVSDENRPFNGSGSMRQSFASKSAGWKGAIKKRANEKKNRLIRAEEELRSERDGERLAVLDWIRSGANRKAFEDNSHTVGALLANHPITAEFVADSSPGMTRVKIGAILEARCARCHNESAGGAASRFPLETWEQVYEYCDIETAGGGMSLTKLAQSSHVHLLGFAMLYGLTGLVFSLSSYPGWLRVLLGPLPLVAQIVDISMWWLTRLDPACAQLIMISGSIVATGLLLQITLSLFNLFGKNGKMVLVVLLLGGCLGGYVLKEQVIDPYLAKEAVGATASE
jgi:hypothetical protein